MERLAESESESDWSHPFHLEGIYGLPIRVRPYEVGRCLGRYVCLTDWLVHDRPWSTTETRWQKGEEWDGIERNRTSKEFLSERLRLRLKLRQRLREGWNPRDWRACSPRPTSIPFSRAGCSSSEVLTWSDLIDSDSDLLRLRNAVQCNIMRDILRFSFPAFLSCLLGKGSSYLICSSNSSSSVVQHLKYIDIICVYWIHSSWNFCPCRCYWFIYLPIYLFSEKKSSDKKNKITWNEISTVSVLGKSVEMLCM